MQLIDRYELSLPGHMRLIDARSALNHLERFVENSEGPIDGELLAEKMEPLVEALHDAADETRPVDGRDAFMRQACAWDFISLSSRERSSIEMLRNASKAGQEEIFRMIDDIQRRMPYVRP